MNTLVWFDTHAHLFLLESADSGSVEDASGGIAEIVTRSLAAGVQHIVSPGIDRPSSERSLVLSEAFSGHVHAAVGIHPNSAAETRAGDWEVICRLAEDPHVVAIGETGLDWYREFTPREMQLDWFQRHLELAAKVNKPVIIHCRDAEVEVSEVLQAFSRQGSLQGVVHACSAPWETVRRWIDLGLFISFAGSVTFSNRKNAYLRETAKNVPQERLLVETDTPYLVPEPYRGRIRSSAPYHVVQTGEFLAQLRGVSGEDLAQITTNNALKLFAVEGSAESADRARQ